MIFQPQSDKKTEDIQFLYKSLSDKDYSKSEDSDLLGLSTVVGDCLLFGGGFHGFDFAFCFLLDSLDDHTDSVYFALFCHNLKLLVLLKLVLDLLDWSFNVNKLGFLFEESNADCLHSDQAI